MRARNIKPGFFTNDVLAEVDPLGRILFQGLWCHADREGRLECRPRKLKAEILPYDECDIDDLLSQLESRGFISVYSVENSQYIQVVNFSKHQNPHIKEGASSIPAPNGTVQASTENSTSTVQAQCSNSESTERAGLIPDSLNRIPDSPTNPTDVVFDGFSWFWSEYPKKHHKADAEKAWKKIKADPEKTDLILEALFRHRRTRQWQKDNGQFIPNPATWLNRRSWEDVLTDADFADVPSGKATETNYQRTMRERVEELTGRKPQPAKGFDNAIDVTPTSVMIGSAL